MDKKLILSILSVLLMNIILIISLVNNTIYPIIAFVSIIILIILLLNVNQTFQIIKIFIITRIISEILFSIIGLKLNLLWGASLVLFEILYLVNTKLKNKKITKIILVFVYICIFSMIFNSTDGFNSYGITYIVKLLSWLLLIPIIENEDKNINQIVNFMCNIYYIHILLAFLQKFIIPTNMFRYNVNEINGFYETPQAFAFSILFLLPFMYYKLFVENKKIRKFTYALMIGVGYVVILNSFVRTALVGVFVQVGFLMFINKKIKISNKILLIGCFIVFLSVNFNKLVVDENSVVNRLTLKESSNLNEFSSGRLDIYSANLKYFSNANIINKVLGNGFGSTFKASKMYLGSNILAHNDYLDLLIDVGILGASSYVYIIFSLINIIISKRNKKNNYYFYLINLSNIFMMLACAFFNPIITGQFLIYMSVLIGINLSSINSQKTIM